MQATLISETTGSDHNRSAKVYQDHEGYFVELYQDGEAIRQVDVRDHSIHYANDVADNWNSGLIKE